jgi:hypothetical protein
MYKHRILTGMTSLLIAGTLGLAGCSTNTSGNNAASTGNATSNTTQSHTAKQNKNLTSATATLKPQNGSKVEGMATMTLNTKSHELTVVAELTGLKAGQKYEAVIYHKKSGKMTYNLNSIKADKHGDGVFTRVIKKVKKIPSTDSRLGVYQGRTNSKSLLASGDIKPAGKH